MTDAKTAASVFWDIAMKLTVIAAAATCGGVINHEARIARLEGDHFNSNEVLGSIDSRLRGIETAVIRLQTIHELEQLQKDG